MTRQPCLIIRPDGSPDVGAGHVMRTIALAEEHRARNGRVVFVLGADAGPLRDAVATRGFAVREFDGEPGGPEDRRAIMALVNATDADACIVDGYRFPARYYSFLRGVGLRVIAIDDLGRGDLPGDVIVNPNYDPPPTAEAAALLAGTQYALLRSEFRAHAPGYRPRPGHVPRVLIAFGGSDAMRGAARVLARLPTERPVVACVAVGPCYADDGELEHAAELACANGHVVEIARAVSDMASMIAFADFALCAAGSIVWELAHFGCPTAAFAVAPNQVRGAAALARDGYVIGGAPLDHMSDNDIDSVLDDLFDPNVRERIGCRFATLVDGNGPARVIDRIAA